MARTTIREVKFKDNREAVIADWYYAQHASELFTTKEYETLTDFMRDQVYGNLSDGECLDISIDLYDRGISYFN